MSNKNTYFAIDKVALIDVRLNFLNITKPKYNEEKKREEYRVQCLIHESNKAAYDTYMENAEKAARLAGISLSSIKHIGIKKISKDENDKYAWLNEYYEINPFQVVGDNCPKVSLFDENNGQVSVVNHPFYNGCYADVSIKVNCIVGTSPAFKCISNNLLALRFRRDGEKIARGESTAYDLFGATPGFFGNTHEAENEPY